ncbi:MAG: pyrimidine 5'-nucleotidase [Deltaproteobacteria bacterium]|nr:pyrimidine 5'-nucleotidase [Candidatus Anaeroferrophillus wilburensis]MBN2888823.1 pyrimidine 5'-nucleotidase [Deltaproteobacteria bacterium]
MMISADFILFDLDNTLYPRETGLFSRVDRLINQYMDEVVKIPREQVNQLRQQYFAAYGTTLSGLMVHHQVDPEEYLSYVHNVPVDQLIPRDDQLAGLLERLPGEKYIFSNASRSHCDRVLDHLGIAGYFRDIYDIVRMEYRPKPERQVYESIVEEIGLPPHQGIMVDDLEANLVPARELGMGTVLVTGDEQEESGLLKRPAAEVDLVVRSVHQLPAVLKRSAAPALPVSAGS